jgi:hypothetical protein
MDSEQVQETPVQNQSCNRVPKETLQLQSRFVRPLAFWCQTMRFGWRERYESRGSRTVLRGAGVKLPGLLTLNSHPPQTAFVPSPPSKPVVDQRNVYSGGSRPYGGSVTYPMYRVRSCTEVQEGNDSDGQSGIFRTGRFFVAGIVFGRMGILPRRSVRRMKKL